MDEPGWAWEECIGIDADANADAGAATAAQVAGDTDISPACAMQSQRPEKPEGSARSGYRKQRRIQEKQVINALDEVLPPCASKLSRLISKER
jgi:hypothetical protein